MLKIFKYFKWYDWLLSVIILALTVAQVNFDLKLPEYMVKILSSITYGTGEVWTQGANMLLFVLGSVSISVLISLLSSKVSAGLAKRLRKQIFEKVGSFSMAEINKFSTASLITRSTNDVSQVQHVLSMMLKLFMYAPIMAISALIKITSINTTLTLTTFIFIAIMFLFVGTIMILITRKFVKLQKQTDELNNVARENLTGIRVVRAMPKPNKKTSLKK